MEASSPRILVVTAAFGEGHNSAARNLALALDKLGAVTQVADPCLVGMPGLTSVLSRGYRFITNRSPRLWAAFYRSTDRLDFTRRTSPVMRFPERALGRLIDDFRPVAIVSTYPLYPYFLKRLPQGMRHNLPIFTVVTDSIEINAAWLRAPSDWWLVTDQLTREGMIGWGLRAESVVDTGFPVHPVFAEMEPMAAEGAQRPFQIVYFATARKGYVRDHGCALLAASPDVRLTVVMGRNVRRLWAEVKALKAAHPGRVRAIGWSKRVPRLLTSHHLVVGKAGGATVHEAIAAHCPMLIHHLVPGQEEGNLRLLEKIGGGVLADTPHKLQEAVARLLENDCEEWRGMKHALARHDRNSGAQTAARFILDHLHP
jgi:processive 1,2-diacylglycerol beta-glucosyltransferase